MPLILAGIDEAGYGPMLGPLCVGLSAFRARDASLDDPPPDLWACLAPAICRAPTDRAGRFPIADSKRLTAAGPDALAALSRAVLAGLACLNHAPRHDLALLDAVGATLDDAPWYSGQELALPEPLARVPIDANRLRAAGDAAGVAILDLQCRCLCEAAFNALVARHGTKAWTTRSCVGEHLRRVVDFAQTRAEPFLIVADRLGGRTDYIQMLREELPGAIVETIARNIHASTYDVACGKIRGRIEFRVRAEDAFLPVAMASMLAKCARELAMRRFNRHWTARKPDLRPTAGYVTDARRWIKAVQGVASSEDLAQMIRAR